MTFVETCCMRSFVFPVLYTVVCHDAKWILTHGLHAPVYWKIFNIFFFLFAPAYWKIFNIIFYYYYYYYFARVCVGWSCIVFHCAFKSLETCQVTYIFCLSPFPAFWHLDINLLIASIYHANWFWGRAYMSINVLPFFMLNMRWPKLLPKRVSWFACHFM